MKNVFLTVMLSVATGCLNAQTFYLTAFDQPDGYELQVSGDEDIRLIIDGFSPGDYFGVQLRHKPGHGTFDYGALPAGTHEYRGGFLSGTSTSKTLDICLEALEEGPGTVYLSLRKDRGFDRFKSSNSPFEITNSKNLDSLLNVVFRNESCFELFPDTIITGDQVLADGSRVMQTGVFTGGLEVFGMESGIIMSTGAVTDAVGPNSFAPRSQNFASSNTHADSDAASLIPPQFCTPTPQDPFCYADVAIIEFEFVPTTDSISFNYIFFSEEYCFALDAGFGDAFAFFLEGPGVLPNGRANVARLPNGERVSSETLNHIETPSLFVDNSFSSFGPCTGMPNDPATEMQTAYDGFSTKLQIKAAVTPCERHVLKLMVIDALDFNLDSGILLEAGSFTAGLIADPEPSVSGIPGSVTPVEACDTATLTFSRLFSDSSDIAEPLAVRYNLITTGTGINLADNNLDFELPPSPFIIPAGDSTAVLKIPILGDLDNNEGIEAFIIKYDGTCNCDQNRDTFYIQDAVDLVLDLTSDQTICAGENLPLTVSTSGGAPPYAYEWPDGQTTNQVTYSSTGRDTTIYVTVVDSCGLVGLDSIQLVAPNVSASTAGNFSLCSSPTASVLVDVEGTGPFTINLRVDSNGTTTNTIYVLNQDSTFLFDTDAIVSVTSVSDATGCGGSATGTATVTSAGVSLVSEVVQPTCDDNNGSINLMVSGGNANHTFSWMDDASAMTGNRTGLMPGTYSVDVAPVNDPTCAQTFNFTLTPPAPFVFDSFTYLAPICEGDVLDIAVVVSGGTAPYEFFWPDSMNMDSILQITSQAGNFSYPVRVTDACGLELNEVLNIDLPVFGASLSGRYSLCNGSPVIVPVDVTGPDGDYILEVEITRGTTVDTILRPFTQVISPDQVTFPISEARSIRLLGITNSAGCSGTLLDLTAEVVDPQINFASSVIDVSCNGDSTGGISLLNPGTVPLTFRWSDGPTTADRSGLAAGSYSLRIEDAADSSCFRDTTFNILQPASAITMLSDSSRNETCTSLAYASANYSGGTGDLTYSWSNGTSGNVLGEVPAGMYQLTVSDENNCEIVQTFNLQDRRTTILANISATASELSCTQSSLMLSAQQNIVPVTYTWQNENGLEVGNARNLTINTPGSYSVTVVDPATGCFATDTIEITRDGELLDLELDAINALNCDNQSVDLTVSHPAYPDPVTYEWRLNNTLVGSTATLPGITSTGIYEVTVIRQDNGCPTVATTEVLVDRNDPTVSVPTPVVTSNCTSLEVTVAVAANGPYSYLWSTTNGNLTGATDQITTTADQPGTYNVTVRDTTNGCTVDRSVEVIQDGAVLTALAGTDQTLVCSGLGTILFGDDLENSNTLKSRWYSPSGEVISETQQAFATEAGAFVFEVIHPESGCSSFDTVMVINNGPTTVAYTLQQAPCPEVGGRLFVTDVTGNNGPFTFSSPTGETDLSGNSLRGLDEGDNILIVTDQLGCELRDTFQIFDFGEFTGSAPDVEVQLGEEATLGVQTNRGDGALVQWTWGNLPDSLACFWCPEPTLRPLESFIATVAVLDSNGCVLNLRQNVIVNEQELVYLPTGFSPANGDGINDVYTVFGNQEFVSEITYFGVFDRWGSQVFQNLNFQVNDPDAGWDGTINGKDALPAVYVYTLNVRYYDGREETIRGSFTLVR